MGELAWNVIEHREQSAPLAVLETIEAVLGTRIDRLPPEEKRLLQLFRVLLGLWYAHGTTGGYQARRALGERLLSLAQHLQEPDLLLEAHHALWIPLEG